MRPIWLRKNPSRSLNVWKYKMKCSNPKQNDLTSKLNQPQNVFWRNNYDTRKKCLANEWPSMREQRETYVQNKD